MKLRQRAESHGKTDSAMPGTDTSAMPIAAATPDLSDLEFTGNKTNLVVAIVGRHGAAGATPKEVDAVSVAGKLREAKT